MNYLLKNCTRGPSINYVVSKLEISDLCNSIFSWNQNAHKSGIGVCHNIFLYGVPAKDRVMYQNKDLNAVLSLSMTDAQTTTPLCITSLFEIGTLIWCAPL